MHYIRYYISILILSYFTIYTIIGSTRIELLIDLFNFYFWVIISILDIIIYITTNIIDIIDIIDIIIMIVNCITDITYISMLVLCIILYLYIYIVTANNILYRRVHLLYFIYFL